MANVNKVELGLNRKIANPFKTTRKSTTNPFKFSDFEGNTLDASVYADVFDGNSNKLKMISSSVIGTLTKIRTGITEPIANFVKRVKTTITSAWDYAKNTNVEIAGLKNISEGIHGALNNDLTKGIINALNYDVGKGISDSISGIGKNISENLSYLNKDIKDVGADILTSCTSLIKRTHHEKPSPAMSVEVLENMLRTELDADQSAKEIALKSANSLKEVA